MLNQPAFEASVRAKQELLEQGFCKLSNILHPQGLLQILLGASRLELAACDSLREYLNKADPKPRASTVLGTVSFNDDKQVQQIQSLLRLDLDGAGVFKTLANDLTPLLAFLLGVTEGELDVCATLYEHHRSDPECCFSQDNICTNLQNGQELVVAHILLDTHMDSSSNFKFVQYSHLLPTLEHTSDYRGSFRVQENCVPGYPSRLNYIRDRDATSVDTLGGDLLVHLGTTIYKPFSYSPGGTGRSRRVTFWATARTPLRCKLLIDEAERRLSCSVSMIEKDDPSLYEKVKGFVYGGSVTIDVALPLK
mgnify:CR=1 FL=1